MLTAAAFPDYRLLATALAQRLVPPPSCVRSRDDDFFPLFFDGHGPRVRRVSLTPELSQWVAELHYRLWETLRALPPPLTLVFRSVGVL